MIFVFGIELVLGSTESLALLFRTDTDGLGQVQDSNAIVETLLDGIGRATGLFLALFAGFGLVLLLHDHVLTRADEFFPATASATLAIWAVGFAVLLSPHVDSLSVDSLEDDPLAGGVLAVLGFLLGSLLWLV